MNLPMLVLTLVTIFVGLGIGKSALGQKPIEEQIRELTGRVEELATRDERAATEAVKVAAEYRSSLVDIAAKLARWEKEAAKSELERASRELEGLTYKRKLQDWALGSFAQGERFAPRPSEMNKRLTRALKVQENFKTMYIELPSDPGTLGAITSGRALNFFLDACGPVAVEHRDVMDKLEATKKECELALAGKEDIPPDALARLEAVRKTLDDVANLIKGIGGKESFEPHDYDNLMFQKGRIAEKSLVRNEPDGALPLRWPTVIRLNPIVFGELTSQIEIAKSEALANLKKGIQIEPHTIGILLKSVEELEQAFVQERRAYSEGARDSSKTSMYIEANNFLRTLRSDVVRFAAAEDVSDVQPSEPFEGKTLEELLVYMRRNVLRFPEKENSNSNRNDERVNTKIFQDMVRYYMNLHRLRLLAEKANEEDDRWQQYSDHQMAILSKDTMADLAKVARESAPRHYHEGKDVPLSEEIRNYAEAASATVSVLKELHLID